MSLLSSLAGAPLLQGKRNKGVAGKTPGSNYAGYDTACMCSLSAGVAICCVQACKVKGLMLSSLGLVPPAILRCAIAPADVNVYWLA